MDKGLMAKESWESLGYKGDEAKGDDNQKKS